MMAVCEVFAADVGGKPQDLLLVQLGRDGRREVVADDDARFLEMLQVNVVRPPQQIVEHTLGDIAHVGGAFSEIIVLNCGQRGGVTLRHRVERIFDVDLLLLNHPDDFIQERAVFQHQQMRVKNAAVLSFHLGADLVLHFQNLLPGLGQCFFKAVQLLRQFRVAQLPLRHRDVRFAEHEDFPLAYARRNGNALENLFPFVSKL